MSYALARLRTMTLKQLATAGDDLGLTFTKNHNKAKRISLILAQQVAQAVAETPAEDSRPDEAPSRPSAPSFERLTDGDDAPTNKPDNRGGPREGAGRPEGMTADRAAMNRLSKQPHPFVKSTLEMLFARWSSSVGCREIALDKDEACSLALAWTQVGDYLGVTDKIPIWLQLAITAMWTTANIIGCKARIAREYLAAHEPKPEAEPVAEAA